MDGPFWKRFSPLFWAMPKRKLFSLLFIIIEVTEAEKKSSSHPSAEVSFQSKRKKRESREAPPPLLRLLSGQPSSKTYALLRNGLTVITLLKVLDWVAKQLSWANLSLLLALVPWERHMVSVCLMGSCKTLKWIVKKIQYFQIRLFRPMQDGWWLVRLWAGRQRCAGSSKRLLFTGLSSFPPHFYLYFGHRFNTGCNNAMTSTTNMSRDHTFVHSTFLQTATGKGIAGQCILHWGR